MGIAEEVEVDDLQTKKIVYIDMTLFCMYDKLYARFHGGPDVPFLEIDKQTLKVVQDGPKFTGPGGSGNPLRWPSENA